jgi:hypothetical protein
LQPDFWGIAKTNAKRPARAEEANDGEKSKNA